MVEQPPVFAPLVMIFPWRAFLALREDSEECRAWAERDGAVPHTVVCTADEWMPIYGDEACANYEELAARLMGHA